MNELPAAVVQAWSSWYAPPAASPRLGVGHACIKQHSGTFGYTNPTWLRC